MSDQEEFKEYGGNDDEWNNEEENDEWDNGLGDDFAPLKRQ